MEDNYNDLSNNELIKLVKQLKIELKRTKKYGLTWDKENNKETALLDLYKNIPVLKRKCDLDIVNNKSSEINNVIIKGDNLPALAAMNLINDVGIADIICIDPPYNTGKKTSDGGFMYNDSFVGEEDAYYHSKWLNFMEKRLKLAKNLLSDKGVVFINISDKELFNLKLLCDSIFGENNFIGNIIQNKGNAQNDAIDLQINHDYCLCYCKKRFYKTNKSGKKTEIHHLFIKDRQIKECFKDTNGRYYYEGSGLVTGSAPTLNARPNLGYTIYFNPKTLDTLAVDDYNHELAKTSNDEKEVYSNRNDLLENGYIAIRPPKHGGKLGRWTWSCDKFNNEKNKILIKKSKKNNYTLVQKVFVKNDEIISKNSKYYYEKTTQMPLKSIIDYPSASGTKELLRIIGPNDFNNPKNVDYIKYLINSYNDKNCTVLDFFAGSGTTGQAVLELNKEDSGKRKFILCTNNENDIFDKVCYPRIKNLLTGNLYNDKIEKIKDANLYCFDIANVSYSSSDDQTKFNMVSELESSICFLENCFNLYKRTSIYSIYTDNNGKAFCVYPCIADKTIANAIINEMKQFSGDKIIYLFSLSDNDNEYDSLFSENYSLPFIRKVIPTKSYNIYKTIIKDLEEDL